MAITKQKLTTSGVVTAYHRLLRYSIDFAPVGANPGVDGPLVSATLGEYVSAELRDAGAQPVRHEHVTFVMPIAECDGNMRAAIYARLLAPGELYGDPLPAAPAPATTTVVEA